MPQMQIQLTQDQIMSLIMRYFVFTQREFFEQSTNQYLDLQNKRQIYDDNHLQKIQIKHKHLDHFIKNNVYLTKNRVLSQDRKNEFIMKQKRFEQLKSIRQQSLRNDKVLKIDCINKIQYNDKNIIYPATQTSLDNNIIDLQQLHEQKKLEKLFKSQNITNQSQSIQKPSNCIINDQLNYQLNSQNIKNQQIIQKSMKQILINNLQDKLNQKYEDKSTKKTNTSDYNTDYFSCKSTRVQKKDQLDILEELNKQLQNSKDYNQTINKDRTKSPSYRFRSFLQNQNLQQKNLQNKLKQQHKSIISNQKYDFLNYSMSEQRRASYQRYLNSISKCLPDLDLIESQRQKFNFPRTIKQYQDVQLFKNLIEYNQDIQNSIQQYCTYNINRQKYIKKQLKICKRFNIRDFHETKKNQVKNIMVQNTNTQRISLQNNQPQIYKAYQL